MNPNGNPTEPDSATQKENANERIIDARRAQDGYLLVTPEGVAPLRFGGILHACCAKDLLVTAVENGIHQILIDVETGRKIHAEVESDYSDWEWTWVLANDITALVGQAPWTTKIGDPFSDFFWEALAGRWKPLPKGSATLFLGPHVDGTDSFRPLGYVALNEMFASLGEVRESNPSEPFHLYWNADQREAHGVRLAGARCPDERFNGFTNTWEEDWQ